MKLNLFFKTTLAVASLGAFLTACNDDKLLDDAADAKGNGAATITVGNGDEVVISTNTTWTANNTYVLDGFVRVKGNATLTIEAGTVVKGLEGGAGREPGTLMIERNGRLVANGTPSNPIVFTSAKSAGSRAPGDWGGIIWCGKAYVNVKQGSKAPLRAYEGLVEGLPGTVEPAYYGSGSGDASLNYNFDGGSLTYARIEFAGNILSEGNETNGLTLAGLGAGTTIHHVQVSYGADDGFEWFGGSVDQKFLIAYRNEDDDFDTDQGFWGRLQYGIVLRDPALYGNGSGGSRGLESNGDDDDAKNLNLNSLSDPMYSQITVLGPNGPDAPLCSDGSIVAGGYNDGIVVRDQSQIDVFNSVIAGWPTYGVRFENVNDFYNDRTKFQNNRVVAANVTGAETTNTNVPNDFQLKLNTIRYATGCWGTGNDVATQAGLKRRAWALPNLPSDSQPDFTVAAASPLVSGAVYTNFRFTSVWRLQNPAFWDQVPFKNAVGVSGATGGTGAYAYGGDWFMNDGWVDWTPNN